MNTNVPEEGKAIKNDKDGSDSTADDASTKSVEKGGENHADDEDGAASGTPQEGDKSTAESITTNNTYTVHEDTTHKSGTKEDAASEDGISSPTGVCKQCTVVICKHFTADVSENGDTSAESLLMDASDKEECEKGPKAWETEKVESTEDDVSLSILTDSSVGENDTAECVLTHNAWEITANASQKVEIAEEIGKKHLLKN